MKIWKVTKVMRIVAYVKVSEDCKIYDDMYEALELVRKEFNDFSICGTQLLDVEHGEQMQEGIPVFTLE